MNTVHHLVHDGPVGPLRLAACDAGLVAVWMSAQRHVPDDVPAHWSPAGGDARTTAILDATRRQLDAYFAGTLTAFDLPLAADGTAFQRSVWHALCTIRYGETISYGELARRIGAPKAVRAVGLANGRNPLSIVVPCHRVIGADGSMTGYGGGLERKEYLLALERRVAAAGDRPPFALADETLRETGF